MSGSLTPVALPGGGVPGPEPASPPGGMAVGFYGKLPARGDFVRAGLPRDFTDRWDDWLQSVIAGSRALMGEAWLPAFLEAPVWRFALPPGMCGERAALGLMLPSVDKAGRYFPLTFAALPAAGTSAAGLPMLIGRRASRRALPMPHRAPRVHGSIVARPLDEPPWNAIRRHRKSRTRLAGRICRTASRNVSMACGGATARRASSLRKCFLAACRMWQPMQRCWEWMQLPAKRNSRFRGKPHGIHRHDCPAFPFLGRDTSWRQTVA